MSETEKKAKPGKTENKKSVLQHTPMRARKKKAKARTVGALAVQGKTNREIASAINSSVGYVKKLKREPDAQAMMDAFFQRHYSELCELGTLSIEAVSQTLQAGVQVKDKRTKEIFYVADHTAMLRAVERVQEWQKMSQSKSVAPASASVTINDLEQLLKEHSENSKGR